MIVLAGVAIALFVAVAFWYLISGYEPALPRAEQPVGTREMREPSPWWDRLRRWYGMGGRYRREHHPFLAALVVVTFLVITLLGVLNGVLGGMHIEGDETVTASSLTGGLFGWASPEEIDEALGVWSAWESDNPTYPTPGAVATFYFLVDSLFAVLYGVFILWGIVALRVRLLDRSWRKALWIVVLALGVSVGADLTENLAMANAVADGEAPPLIWLVIAKFKWLVLPVLLAMLYVLLVARFVGFGDDDSWARRLPQFVRGFSSIRVGLITVVLTWFVLFGPLLGQQMFDVIRRWDPLQAVAVVLLTLFLAGFAGQSSRRVFLRVATGTPRHHPLPGLAEDPNARVSWRRSARRWRYGAAAIVVALAVLGLSVWLTGNTFGRGLLVPGALLVLLWLMGAPLRERDVLAMSGRPRRVGHLMPRLVAAGIPLIVGLAVARAVLPDVVLRTDNDPLWPLVFVVVALALAVGLYLVLDRVRHRLLRVGRGRSAEERDRLLETLGQRVAMVITLVAVTLVFVGLVIADVRQPPGLDDGLRASVQLLLAAGLLALAHFGFYLFEDSADERKRVADAGRPWDQPTVVRSPASLIPGPGMRQRGWRAVWWIGLIVAFVVIMVRVLWDPIQLPQSLGGTSVALLWVLLVGLALEAVTRFAEVSVPPRVLQHVSLRRSPVILGVAVWLGFMAFVWQSPGFHDEDILTTANPPIDEVSLEEVFDAWVDQTGARDAAEGEVQPMFFVSAWGGGIRAAVWTGYVVDCAFGPSHAGDKEVCVPGQNAAGDHVITMSGISGGSLGFVEYLAATTAGSDSDDWVKHGLSDDYLSPALGRLFFVDIPLSMIGGTSWIDDRADVLRRAWEASWNNGELSRGMLDVWAERGLPLVVANGTSVNDACAINVSPLRTTEGGTEDDCTSLAPFVPADGIDKDPSVFFASLAAAHDIVAFLGPDEDISLATMALMSARFPAISPTGRVLAERARRDGSTGEGLDAIYTTDGGQLELSGALMSVQLWEALEPLIADFNAAGGACIVPVAIHIENGFGENVSNTSDELPNEWLDPLVWSGTSAKGGLVANARQRLALEFSEPLAAGGALISIVDGPPRFIFLRTRAHPGITAPLGWTLSEATFNDLRRQTGENAAEFDAIQRWLGDLTCNRVVATAGD